jgi:glycopeptide antibiotics resistance protein
LQGSKSRSKSDGFDERGQLPRARRSRRSWQGWLWWASAGVIVLWLLWMTLRPNPTVAADLYRLTEPAAARGISSRLLIGLAGNVVVFVPLGAALALALRVKPVGRRFLMATLIGAALSLAIELVQMAIPSRVTAVSDVLLNTVGTAAGAFVGCWIASAYWRSGIGD